MQSPGDLTLIATKQSLTSTDLPQAAGRPDEPELTITLTHTITRGVKQP